MKFSHGIRIAVLFLFPSIAGAVSAAGSDSLFLASPGRIQIYELRDADGVRTGTEIQQLLRCEGDWKTGSAVLYQRVLPEKSRTDGLSPGDTLALPEEILYHIRSGEAVPDLAGQLKATVLKAMDQVTGEVSDDERREIMQQLEEHLCIDGDVRGIPKDLTPGKELPAYGISLRFMIFRMKVEVSDRRALAREIRKTPAGAFDCFLVTERTRMKMMGKKEESVIRTWYARGIGPVRRETFDRKGKLQSVQELVSFGLTGGQPDTL